MPFVDSTFYSTVSMVRTMETLLGLPPMNSNDAFSSMMRDEFSGPGDQPAFTVDPANRDNGLIYTANKPTAPGARTSSRMDFRHADRADAQEAQRHPVAGRHGREACPGGALRKAQKNERR